MNPTVSDPVPRINQFTAGMDRSDSPQMRRAAQEYACCCAELNLVLAGLRDLLDHGRAREALERAAAIQPPLAEQAEKLRLADPEIFLEAAADYGWEMPPEIAVETLQRLAAVASELPRLQPLLAQWRSAARSPDDAAKLALLRQLVLADPAHARNWKENLLTVEQRYTEELLRRAEDPQLPMAELQKIAGELLSPRLSRPLPAALVQPLLTRLRTLQQEELRRRADLLLNRIAAADGAADFAALEAALQEYDRLAGDPDFTAPAEASDQLAAARKTLETHRNRIAAAAAAKTLKNALEDALDRQRSAAEVERIFRRLQAVTEEIPAALAERAASYLELVRFRENRRHFRMLFAAGVAALLLIVPGVFAVRWYVRERTCREFCRRYERQLAGGADGAAVLKALEAFAAAEPQLAARPEVQAIRARAERQFAANAAAAADFDGMVLALEVLPVALLTAPETEQRLQQAGALLRPEDAPRRERLAALVRKRETALDARKQAAYAALLERAAAWQQSLQANLQESDPAVQQKGFERLGEELERLTRQAKTEPLDPENRDRQLQILRQQLQLRQEIFQRRMARAKMQNDLQHPETFERYLAALQGAAADPEYSRQFARAVAAAPFWRQLAGLRLAPESWEREEEVEHLTSLLPYLPGGCRQLLAALLPEGKCNGGTLLKAFQKETEAFQRTFSEPEYQVKMLALTGDDGLPCRFYTAEPVTVERAGRRIKGMEIALLTAPGGKGTTSLFSISGTRVFPTSPLSVNGFALPEEYVLPDDVRRFPEELSAPAHQRLLESMAGALRNAPTPQAALAALDDAFRQIRDAADLEPVIRRRMTAALLHLTGTLFPLAAAEIRAVADQLPVDGPPFANWCDPALSRREPDAYRQYGERLQQVDGSALIARILHLRNGIYRLLSRDPVPLGVLRRAADGSWRCEPFPVSGVPQEAWIINPGDDSGFCKIVGRMEQGKLHLAPAAEPFFWDGLVLWTPLIGPDSRALQQELQKEGIDLLPFTIFLPVDLTAAPSQPAEARP